MATSSGAPRPISAIRPVNGAAIAAQRSLYKIPLVGAHHVLRHPDETPRRGVAVFIGEGQKYSIAADRAVFGAIALGTPVTQEAGVPHRTLQRRHRHCAGRL